MSDDTIEGSDAENLDLPKVKVPKTERKVNVRVTFVGDYTGPRVVAKSGDTKDLQQVPERLLRNWIKTGVTSKDKVALIED